MLHQNDTIFLCCKYVYISLTICFFTNAFSSLHTNTQSLWLFLYRYVPSCVVVFVYDEQSRARGPHRIRWKKSIKSKSFCGAADEQDSSRIRLYIFYDGFFFRCACVNLVRRRQTGWSCFVVFAILFYCCVAVWKVCFYIFFFFFCKKDTQGRDTTTTTETTKTTKHLYFCARVR